MHPILFSFNNVTLYTYGFFVAMGFLAATLWAYYQVGGFSQKTAAARLEGCISGEQLLSLVIWLVVSGIIGARIFYVIQFWPQFADNYWQILNIRGGGLVFYGGIISGLITLFVFCKLQRLFLLNVLDLVTPAVILGYGFGRIGCFFEGCCYGKPCTLPWAVHFPLLDGLHHPTQIYSSAIAFLIFGLLVYFTKHQRKTGQIFFWGLILHSGYRFGIEFLRTNPLYYGLSSAQWIAMVLMAMGLAGLLFIRAARRPMRKS